MRIAPSRNTYLGLKAYSWYRLFKYSIYVFLCANVLLFFREDISASAQTFSGAISWNNVVEAFSATIDTASWVILLLLFELETAVISDDRLKRGSTKWVMLAVRSVCYFFIIYSFYGYWAKFQLVSQFVPFVVQDACSLVGTTFTQVVDLDEYVPITLHGCAALNGLPLVQIVGTEIIATRPAIDAAVNLSIVDVINAGDWLLVVALLEVEVFLQIRQVLNRNLMRIAKILKAAIYSVLLGCAIYWGLNGDFLDFWDAFLWLVAFVFIELNVFEWQAELQAQQHDVAPSGGT